MCFFQQALRLNGDLRFYNGAVSLPTSYAAVLASPDSKVSMDDIIPETLHHGQCTWSTTPNSTILHERLINRDNVLRVGRPRAAPYHFFLFPHCSS